MDLFSLDRKIEAVDLNGSLEARRAREKVGGCWNKLAEGRRETREREKEQEKTTKKKESRDSEKETEKEGRKKHEGGEER